jgi:CHAT domain-containing protein
MVVIAVPAAPGTTPLDGVAHEADALRHTVTNSTVLPAPGTTATREATTAALAKHPIAHFACHGVADCVNPANSRLVLDDHLTDPFTITAIAALQLPDAQMAYLSACSTTGTQWDADEVTDLTGAFQLAGYPTVIGTLWPINDADATRTAQDFYRQLTCNGTNPPDPANAALALHDAVRQQRAAHARRPVHWAAHIHTGR